MALPPRKAAPNWGRVEKNALNGKGDAPHAPSRNLKVVPLSTIPPQKVEWLWYPYIAHGFLTNLGGDPGVGKSYISCALAASMSRGEPLPGQGFAPKPRSVLMLSAEDPAPQVLVPRLITMGADLERIFVPSEPFVLDEGGMNGLRDAMRQCAATIVFIDPVTAYTGGKVDIYRDNEMRAIFTPLARAADETRTAIIIIQHLAKEQGRKDIYRFSGSIANVAAVRSALLAEKLPEGGRVLRHVKTNLGPEGFPRRFDIIDDVFAWGGLYEPPPEPLSRIPKLVPQAQAWLKERLAGGPVDANTMKAEAFAAGFKDRTLSNAKAGLVVSEKEGKGSWAWRLAKEGEGEGVPSAE